MPEDGAESIIIIVHAARMYLCRCLMVAKSPLSQEHLYFYYSSSNHRSDITKKHFFCTYTDRERSYEFGGFDPYSYQ